jgi:hypothetical protein
MITIELWDTINQLIDAIPNDPRAQISLRLIAWELADQCDQLAEELEAAHRTKSADSIETEEAPQVKDPIETLRARVRQANRQLEQNYRDYKNNQG